MVNAWSRLGALAIIAIAATGCGTRVLGHQSTPTSSRPTTQAQPSAPASAASQPPISGASPSAQSACPPWILQDITIADHAKLPVSTTELEGFIGVAMATPQTLPDWLGESPATPIGDALDGWAWSGAMATLAAMWLRSTQAGRWRRSASPSRGRLRGRAQRLKNSDGPFPLHRVLFNGNSPSCLPSPLPKALSGR